MDSYDKRLKRFLTHSDTTRIRCYTSRIPLFRNLDSKSVRLEKRANFKYIPTINSHSQSTIYIHNLHYISIHIRLTNVEQQKALCYKFSQHSSPVENHNFRNPNWSRNVVQFYYNGDQPECKNDYVDDEQVLDRTW